MTYHKRDIPREVAKAASRAILKELAQSYPDKVFVPQTEVRYSRYYDHICLDYYSEDCMSAVNCGLHLHKDGVTLANGSVSFQIDVPNRLWTADVGLPYEPGEDDREMRSIERQLLTTMTSVLREHGLVLETP